MFKFLVISLGLVASLSVYAQKGPQIEPGPVRKLDESATSLANVLLNKSIAECVAKFQSGSPVVDRVSAQALSPTLTRYYIEGMVFLGGDVPVGTSALFISENRTPRLGIGPNVEYKCEYSAVKH